MLDEYFKRGYNYEFAHYLHKSRNISFKINTTLNSKSEKILITKYFLNQNHVLQRNIV